MTLPASHPTQPLDAELASFGAYLDGRREGLAAAVAQSPLLEQLPAERRAELAMRIISVVISTIGAPEAIRTWADDLMHVFGRTDPTLMPLHNLVDAARSALVDAAIDAVAEGVPGARAGTHGLHHQIDVAHYTLAGYTTAYTETEIRRVSTRLDQSLATTPLATIEWDQRGTIMRWNAAAERIFGWTAAEAVGKNIFQLVVPGGQLTSAHEVAASVLRSDHASSLRHENVHKDGRVLVCQWYNAALRDEGGQVVGALSQIEDVTEMLRAEVALRESQEQLIHAQQAALRELNTPLIPLDDDVVVMPLIGSIDSGRAQLVIDTLLEGVSASHARVAILDITGVAVVDTQVANALIRAAQAVKLLGAQVVLTGIRPEVAQTLVGLGVDLSGIATRSSLRAGIQFALSARG